MSGPKVVRVITREEHIATCEGLLARLASALNNWERTAHRAGLTEADIQTMRSRYDALRNALAADRFDEIRRAAPAETEFIQQEQERLHAAAVTRETRKRQIRKRTAEIEAQLRDKTRTSAKPGISAEQLALAEKLKEAEQPQSFEQWLLDNDALFDTETTRIERQLAELSFLLDAHAVTELEMRLAKLEQETSEQQRKLLLDSLTVELATRVKAARERNAAIARLEALAAELQSLGTAGASQRAASVLSELSELSALTGDLASLTALEQNTAKALAAERESVIARARRAAVLQGLASLGYQINEGMETAWVDSGRVVVKRPSQAGYGVELGGKTETGRLQVRVVALRSSGDAADTSRDQDAERMWCSDFSKLQSHIASEGGGLVIERALGVGATPLKVVEDADTLAASMEHAAPARERTLKHP